MTRMHGLGAVLLLAGCSSEGLLGDSAAAGGGGSGDSAGLLPDGDRQATSAVESGTSLSISVILMSASTCDINGDGYEDAYLDAYNSATDMVAYGSASGLRTPSTFSATSSDSQAGPSIQAACVGDVNGDGYDDVYASDYMEGRYGYVSGTTGYEGFLTLFYGGASGLQTTDAGTTWGSGRYDNVGIRPRSLGDLDGDGERDWGYGHLGYDGGETDEGAVVIRYSSLAFGTTLDSDVASAGIGACKGGVGDVNGDGYGDLVVCESTAYTDALGSGNLRLYYGSASGVDTTPVWVASATLAVTDTFIGTDVVSGGDLDGDGYSDIVIAGASGAVHVWYGSASGPAASADLSLTMTGGYYAGSTTVADFDADGYADVAADHAWSRNCEHWGNLEIYRGSASGLMTTADFQIGIGDGSTSYLGDYGAMGLTSGDYDADGAADLLVPVQRDTNGSCYTWLNARVFYGDGVDTDADGSFDAYDCETTDSSVHPGATESCDMVDSDCDGDRVDGFPDLDGDGTPNCVDDDVDGDGDPGATDCDDGDATVGNGFAETVADGVDQDCDGGDTCRADADADGYAATTSTVASSDLDCTDLGEAAPSLPATDCDDASPAINPGIPEVVDDGVDSDCDGGETCYADLDSDGHRATSGTVASADLDCNDAREGATAERADDCNDGSASVHPGATEAVGDEIDADCDGGETCYADGDDDGYLTASPSTIASADADCDDAGEGGARDPTTDCDDGAATVYPGATEGVGDEVDANCDGGERCYADVDADGYGSSSVVSSADTDCADAGEARVAGDCAASDATISPSATEVCDAADVDEDCDGLSDDDDGSLDPSTATDWYRDVDGDGYGDAATATSACSAPRFYVAAGTDCDDGDRTAYPSASETVGNGHDADCDGLELCYVDADGDDQRDEGGATVASANLACDGAGEATSAAALDCDDGDATIYDGAPEVMGDGVDQDCEGGDTCARDADGDGHGTAETVASRDLDCADGGEAATADDCDDGAAGVYPGAEEEPADEVDQDCDGGERCYRDDDGDGYRTGVTVASDDPDCADPGEAAATLPAGDCDDGDPAAWPDAPETVANGADEDCDGGERCWVDGDGDGVGVPEEVDSEDLDCAGAGESATSDDCDDANPTVFPGAEETVASGVDEDCDGGELCWADADHDGFGAEDGSTVVSDDLTCTDPGEYEGPPTDCDDGAATAHPGGVEVEGNQLDEDCDGEAVGAPDASDGAGEAACGCAADPRGGGVALALLGAFAALARRRDDSRDDRPARRTPNAVR
jgi:hypothetical protein